MDIDIKMLLKSDGAKFEGLDAKEVVLVAAEMLVSGEDFKLEALSEAMLADVLKQAMSLKSSSTGATELSKRDFRWLRGLDSRVVRTGMDIAKNEQEYAKFIAMFEGRKKSLLMALDRREVTVGLLMKNLQNLYGFATDKVINSETGEIMDLPESAKSA